MPLQVNTLVAEETAADIPAVYELLETLRCGALEPVLPDLGGAGKSAAAAPARRGREADGVDLPDLASRAVHRRHHGSAFVPARGPRNSCAPTA